MKYFYSLVGSFVLVVAAVYLLGVQFNWYGNLEHAGDSVADVYPRNLVEEKSVAQENFMPGAKQILFGDTHVHTSYSTDAFLWSLPILNGEGPHPISDACDYARFCSALDFWVTTDHAEASTPQVLNFGIAIDQTCTCLAKSLTSSGNPLPKSQAAEPSTSHPSAHLTTDLNTPSFMCPST